MKNAKKDTATKKTDILKKVTVKAPAVKKAEQKASKLAEINSDVCNNFAIFQTGGKQYQAIPGRTLAVEKLEGEAGHKIAFSEVLFRKTGQDTFEFGHPFIDGATVQTSIVKQTKSPKVIIFKFQRRKKRRTKTGHRQPMTVIRIESV